MFIDLSSKSLIDTGIYPNGEMFCRNYPIENVLWKNPNMNDIALAVNILAHCKKMYISFLPYSRSDRNFFLNQKEPILRTILKMLSVYPEKEIYIMDPHVYLENIIDDTIESKIYTYSCIPDIFDYVCSYLNKEFTVVFPDESAMKRYSYLVVGKFSWICFSKTRDNNGNVDTVKVIDKDDSYGSYDSYLMIDDICSYGGTFLNVINNLGEENNYYLITAHCEDNILNGKLIHNDSFKMLFTSNSLFEKNHKKIKVVYNCERKI